MDCLGVVRAAASVAAVLTALSAALAAQNPTPVRGTVVDAETGAPLQGASITAQTNRRATTSDRLGRFTLWISRFPDTIVIAVIGRSPAVLPVTAAPPEPLLVRLATQPVTLSDVIVTAPPGAARPLEDVGRWQIPISAARALPPAIEPDVLRSLALVPGVSFSTPLSARPIIRGYDAGESTVRIDGFEVLNLYHIGRVFSAFPADAAHQVSVSAAPQGALVGGTLSGNVDITGQRGEAGRTSAGVDLSLVSATAWAGGGGAQQRWFGAVRAVHLSVLNQASGANVPYDFQDAYLNALLLRKGRPAGSITAFASRDHLFDRDLGGGMDWSNLLLGGRWQAVDDARFGINVWASANRFAEDVSDVPARHSRIDVRNRFERLGGGADAVVRSDRSQFSFGLSAARRAVGNRIVPRSGDEFVTTDAAFGLLELGMYGEWTVTAGGTSVQLGARLDAAGAVRPFQPRARVSIPLLSGTSIGVAVGRTARLYHLVSDPQSEPELAFYDFWLNAGTDGVPVPVSDHATVDIDVVRGGLAGRVSVFGSRARGLVELRPSSDQRAAALAPFRHGRARTAGVEVQVGLRGTSPDARSLSATYVLSFAQREWGAGWIAWSQERRHLVRVIGRTGLGTRWSAFAAFEALSGPPLTPVDGVVLIALPDPIGPGLSRDLAQRPAYVYGEENSQRSSGTARVDLGIRYSFTGPWKSRAALGVSIINAGFGPVAPLRPAPPTFDPGTGSMGRVRYERMFELPAVPSITLRVEF